jgi:flagellum-specific peptidoglycan hydrolase FlgJ
MFRKIVLSLLAVLIVSCNSSKPVVRTTKTYNKPKRSIAQTYPKRTATTVKTATNKVSTAKPVETKKQDVVIAKKATETNQNNSKPTANTTEVLEATTRVKVTTKMVLEYIEKYKTIAKDNMVRTNIPASITLGQAILESGAGTGPLSVQANNHFGIKCHKEWTGDSIKYDDDEEDECFRKYDDPSQSFVDHSYFLTSRPWYEPLFELEKDDYKSWAEGLKNAGYATDPKYPQKLISLIERYQLQRFDAEVLGKGFLPSNSENDIVFANDSRRYTVIKGDTLFAISKRFNISIEDLKRKNNLTDYSISLGQSIIVK